MLHICQVKLDKETERKEEKEEEEKSKYRHYLFLNNIQLAVGLVAQNKDRVLSFFSSPPKWDSPTPSPADECILPPLLVGGGGAHTRLQGEGLGVPYPTRGQTLFYSRYIYVLCRW
jgi:hypothetical protein